jgi:hypothetical protein
MTAHVQGSGSNTPRSGGPSHRHWITPPALLGGQHELFTGTHAAPWCGVLNTGLQRCINLSSMSDRCHHIADAEVVVYVSLLCAAHGGAAAAGR